MRMSLDHPRGSEFHTRVDVGNGWLATLDGRDLTSITLEKPRSTQARFVSQDP